MTLEIHPKAYLDAQATYDLYFAKDPSLAEDFTAKLEAVLLAVLKQPARFHPYKFGTRRALLKRFSHQVIFHHDEVSSVIRVLAVAHTSRRTAYWRDRL